MTSSYQEPNLGSGSTSADIHCDAIAVEIAAVPRFASTTDKETTARTAAVLQFVNTGVRYTWASLLVDMKLQRRFFLLRSQPVNLPCVDPIPFNNSGTSV